MIGTQTKSDTAQWKRNGKEKSWGLIKLPSSKQLSNFPETPHSKGQGGEFIKKKKTPKDIKLKHTLKCLLANNS